MIKVGITGGIGSGKTFVCDFFAKKGIKIFNSDKEAKLLYDNPIIKEQIIRYFGEKVFSEEKIDLKKLSNIIFNNQKDLDYINSIIHPMVDDIFNERYKNETGYILKESAILFKSKYVFPPSINIFVYAPIDVRMLRVFKRDKCSSEDFSKRIKNQNNDTELFNLCDYMIVNDEHLPIQIQVDKIHNELSKLTMKYEI